MMSRRAAAAALLLVASGCGGKEEGDPDEVDECSAGTADCDSNASCVDTAEGFECTCDAGFEGDGRTCDDLDECAEGTDDCGVDATCENTPGSFDCACGPGFEGDGRTCSDLDECAQGTDDCDDAATCENTVGAFECACGAGFEGDGRTCDDLDECALGTDDCGPDATCDNAPGSFECTCNQGFEGDGRSCADVDECVQGTADCDPTASCVNVVGGVRCELVVAEGETVSFGPLAVPVTEIANDVLSADGSGFSPGDDVLLIALQGTVDELASVGNYEQLVVTAADEGTVTVQPAPALGYGDPDLDGHDVFLQRIPTYDAVRIDGTLVVTGFSAGGTGIVAFHGSDVVVDGAIDVSAAGYAGAGYGCNGVAGRPGGSVREGPPLGDGPCVGWDDPDNLPWEGGGGGGLSDCNTYQCTSQQIGAGGGGGSYGTEGTAGENNGALHVGGLPGLVYGTADLSGLYLGSAGGAGAGGSSGPGQGSAYKGHGGGIVLIDAETITVTGAIRSDGEQGGENDNCLLTNGSGSGGGGAGGSIHLRATTLELATVEALGGDGGCQGGGDGGMGRIRLDCGTLGGEPCDGADGTATVPTAFVAPIE